MYQFSKYTIAEGKILQGNKIVRITEKYFVFMENRYFLALQRRDAGKSEGPSEATGCHVQCSLVVNNVI